MRLTLLPPSHHSGAVRFWNFASISFCRRTIGILLQFFCPCNALTDWSALFITALLTAKHRNAISWTFKAPFAEDYGKPVAQEPVNYNDPQYLLCLLYKKHFEFHSAPSVELSCLSPNLPDHWRGIGWNLSPITQRGTDATALWCGKTLRDMNPNK